MSLLIPAIALLALSIFMAAYGASRKGNSLQHITFSHVALLLVTFGLLIGGAIMLFNAAGWKWGLFGTVISWLIFLIVAARAGAPKYMEDTTLVTRMKEINQIKEEHQAELDELRDSISSEEGATWAASFLDDLRVNWPHEYQQVTQGKLPYSVQVDYNKSLGYAFSVGYMRGKGWITQEHLTDFIIHLGFHFAEIVGQAINAKSNDIAFASGFTVVATKGHLKALDDLSG